jgi:tetratricopeptide (TPR) repeat protein
MSLEALARKHVRRIERFVAHDPEVLLSLRAGHGAERLAARLVSRLGDEDGRSLAVVALVGPFEDEASFFAAGAARFAESLDERRSEFHDLGVDLGDIEPFAPPAVAVAGAAAAAFAEWVERVQRRADPLVQQLLVVVAPGATPERRVLEPLLLGLVAATSSRRVKYLLIDDASAPRVDPVDVPRRRVVHLADLPRDTPPRDVFRSPLERVLVVDAAAPPTWTASELRRALGAATLVQVALPLTDRWTFFAELEEALARADATAALPPSWAPARSDLAARFAERAERLARPVVGAEGAAALVWVNVTEAPIALVDELVSALARAASSRRVRYVVVVDRGPLVARLGPGGVAVHEVRLSASDAIAGYEASLADPDLELPERVRHLCALSAFLGASPSGRDPATAARSIALAREAAELSAPLSPIERATALVALGAALALDRRHADARDAFAAATRDALAGRSATLAAASLVQVGIAHAHMAEWDPAAKTFQAAADLYKRVGDRSQELHALVFLGDVEERRDRLEEAARAWLGAVERLRGAPRTGGALREAIDQAGAQAHERLARLYERAADPPRATEHRERARALGSTGLVLEAF